MTKLHEMTFRGTPQEVKDQLIAKETYEKGEYALIVEVCDDYRLREVEHITSPEALLVDCMVQNDCTAKDAIKLLLKDENTPTAKMSCTPRTLRSKRGSAHEHRSLRPFRAA